MRMASTGIFPEKKVLTEDGYEQTWGVNVLAPFLLTSLLIDSVKERIVNVSSISAGSRIDFDNLNQVKEHVSSSPPLTVQHASMRALGSPVS